jgi:hypothetical protein
MAPAIFNVTTTADSIEAIRNGTGVDAAGQISLRSAMMGSNDLGGPNTIILGPGTYTLTIGPSGSDDDASGDLNVGRGLTENDLTIVGARPGLTIVDGNQLDRVINVGFFSTAIISDLTITHGLVSSIGGSGGGVYNSGRLTLNDDVITGNNVASNGAGIFNLGGTLNIVNTTIANNGTGFGSGGGGLFNQGGTVTLTNCTITGNTATNGGGIFTFGSSPLTLDGCTVANNTSTGSPFSSGGGLLVGVGNPPLNMKDSIVAGNTAVYQSPDINGPVASADHNLIGDASGSSGLTDGANGNQVGPRNGSPINPMLAALQDNGGSTPTMALKTGSPAIGAGVYTAILARDQRGVHRAAPPDLGAVQLQTQGAVLFAIGGSPGRTLVYRAGDGTLLADFQPFGSSFGGSVSVAVGDVNGDGVPDVVVSAGAGNPQIKVYDGASFLNGAFQPGNPDATLIASFFAFGQNFNVGANVAVGDVNNDGYADIVVGASRGNPQVQLYDGKALATGSFNPSNPDSSLLASFFAFGMSFNVGANVAVGDISGNGYDDVVVGATTGNPQVKVYDGRAVASPSFNANPDAHLLASFFAYGLSFGVGAFVAVGDVNGDGFADLITGATAGNPDVHIYNGKDIAAQTFDPVASQIGQFFAYGLNFNVGTTVGAADIENNGHADILTGAAAGSPHFRVVRGDATGVEPPAVNGIEGLPTDLQGGVSVGASLPIPGGEFTPLSLPQEGTLSVR